MSSAAVPWIGVLGAMIFFGSFAVPMKVGKAAKLHPIVFQAYVSIGVLLSSLPIMCLSSWEWSHVTWLGFVSAFMWSVVMILCVLVVDILGVSVGQGIWSGCNAVTAFVEGLLFGEQLGNPALAAVGLVFLIVGIVGLALVGGGGGKGDNESAPLVDGSPSAQSHGRPNGARLMLGTSAALCVGVLAGSIFIPLRYTNLEGLDQVFFAVSFGVGAVLSVAIFLFGHAALSLCGKVEPIGAWGPWQAACPGLICGVLWNMGNICSILSLQPPLGMGVGYPLTQCCILVAGIWGVAYFKEITESRRIVGFFGFALILLCGASMLGIFGSKK